MPFTKCGVVVTRRHGDMELRENAGECLRPYAHNDGKHLFINYYGEYILWQDDDECGCCEPDETDRCFIYERISKEKAKELLTKRE